LKILNSITEELSKPSFLVTSLAGAQTLDQGLGLISAVFVVNDLLFKNKEY
jgi:hypothetical protein